MNNLSSRKLRGGYYTPAPIAEFLIEWALNCDTSLSVLEPSMGDGIFIHKLAEAFIKRGMKKSEVGKNIYGVELFGEEIQKVKDKLLADDFNPDKFNLVEGDFFSIYSKLLSKEKFDLILGNPPFIRYQDFPEEQRNKALKILEDFGFHPNKLTNAWLFFLLVGVQLLNEKGRIAMVIPAELLQVKYAAEARLFLSKFLNSITLLTFKKLVFDGVQQEVVLLLGDKKSGNKGIDLIELNSMDDLKDYKDKIKSPEHFKPIDHSNDKWLQYFLTKEEILLLRKLTENPKLTRLGKLADVDVGVVTGNNDFFVVNKETVEKYELDRYVIPLVGRTEQLNGGIIFRYGDWKGSEQKGNRNYLLNYQDPLLNKIDNGLQKYLEYGQYNGVDKGYKCRIRKIWYSVPSVWVPDAFLFRQIHKYPKLVLNDAKVVSTDTIHRVKIYDKKYSNLIVGSFINSLTFAFSEVYGRSYGGGVLELEPNEAEEVFIPFSPDIKLDLALLDKMLRAKNIEDALNYSDNLLLNIGLGLDKKTILTLRNIWHKLSSRRTDRKVGLKTKPLSSPVLAIDQKSSFLTFGSHTGIHIHQDASVNLPERPINSLFEY